mgnify:CR=1 FL=1
MLQNGGDKIDLSNNIQKTLQTLKTQRQKLQELSDCIDEKLNAAKGTVTKEEAKITCCDAALTYQMLLQTVSEAEGLDKVKRAQMKKDHQKVVADAMPPHMKA